MIGAGASGIAVAEAARRIGATVVLVEKSRFGGASLRSGTLALQALAAAANRTALALSSPQFGVYPEEAPKVAFRRVPAGVRWRLVAGSGAAAPEISLEEPCTRP